MSDKTEARIYMGQIMAECDCADPMWCEANGKCRADLSDAKDKRIEELEAQNRELHMQVIASDSQAQMAYEEQGQLEAKMARVIEVLKRIAGMGGETE
jgi:hypothetical protein